MPALDVASTIPLAGWPAVPWSIGPLGSALNPALDDPPGDRASSLSPRLRPLGSDLDTRRAARPEKKRRR
jgi:hypothetical protein